MKYRYDLDKKRIDENKGGLTEGHIGTVEQAGRGRSDTHVVRPGGPRTSTCREKIIFVNKINSCFKKMPRTE